LCVYQIDPGGKQFGLICVAAANEPIMQKRVTWLWTLMIKGEGDIIDERNYKNDDQRGGGYYRWAKLQKVNPVRIKNIKATIYAEVVIVWGRVVRLKIASYTMMRLPYREIKHWRSFEGFVFTFIVDAQNQDYSTKVQSGRFSKYVFLSKCCR